MTTHTDTERLKAMEAAASKGPWECDTTHNEGSYGAGEDVYEGFKSYTILSEDGKVLFDSLNSDAIEVHEEYDEDGATAWDEIARRNAKLIVAMRNALPDLLDAAERLERQVRAKQQEIEEIAARAQENYERALAAERLASRAREEALRETGSALCEYVAERIALIDKPKDVPAPLPAAPVDGGEDA